MTISNFILVSVFIHANQRTHSTINNVDCSFVEAMLKLPEKSVVLPPHRLTQEELSCERR